VLEIYGVMYGKNATWFMDDESLTLGMTIVYYNTLITDYEAKHSGQDRRKLLGQEQLLDSYHARARQLLQVRTGSAASGNPRGVGRGVERSKHRSCRNLHAGLHARHGECIRSASVPYRTGAAISVRAGASITHPSPEPYNTRAKCMISPAAAHTNTNSQTQVRQAQQAVASGTATTVSSQTIKAAQQQSAQVCACVVQAFCGG
jgi:hypothetical protein